MDGERPIVDQNPEALSFVEKYNTTGCNKVKAEMRDLWKEAHEDFEFAGAILKARKNAFQETVTEGIWMSHEQLTDEMKNEEPALNFESFASRHCLKTFDAKRKCPVYYLTKQLQRCGSKPTGDQETYVVVDVDASKRFASAEHEICPSLTYSRPSLWRCHSRHMQECLSSSTRLTSRRRRMNTTEMWRLQGFPIEEITPLAIARMMVQPAGNSMRVPISSPTSLITCCHACLNSISRGTDRDRCIVEIPW